MSGATVRGALIALLLPPVLLTAGCGGEQTGSSPGEPQRYSAEGDGDGDAGTEADLETADRTVCRADATPAATPYAAGFPEDFTFPASTTVYDVEERPGVGVIVTAISSAPFEAILDHLNTVEVEAGFRIVSGETEEDDAEANWRSATQQGRWAIRRSATCPGETVIQVVAFA